MKYPEIYAACLQIAAQRLIPPTKNILASMALHEIAHKKFSSVTSSKEPEILPPDEREYLKKLVLYAQILYFEAGCEE